MSNSSMRFTKSRFRGFIILLELNPTCSLTTSKRFNKLNDKQRRIDSYEIKNISKEGFNNPKLKKVLIVDP